MQAPIGIFCSSAAAGGLELNVVRMAEWLRRARFPVTLIGSAGSEIARRANELSLPFCNITPDAHKSPRGSIWQLSGMLRTGNYHTLFVHTSKDLRRAVFARLLAMRKVKLVYVQHMQLGVSKRDFLHTLFFRRLAAWIAPLPYLARQVGKMTRFDPRRIFQIPFGIELEPFIDEKPCQTSARLKLGLPVPPVIAGVIGRFDRQKNQTLLIKAAAPLIRKGAPLELLFVGANTLDNTEDYEAELRTEARLSGIEHAVHFRPFQQKVATAYAALDIFVLTSKSETYGMVTIEAMAAGLPVVATRSGGTPELVRDKHDGLLFEPDNTTDLQNALRLLMEFPGLRRRFGQAGRRDALERFSHLVQVSQLAEMVEGLE